MNIQTKKIEKSQIELIVELTVEEFRPYVEKGVKKVSQEVKISGWRPGKVPYDILKQKIGEMTILEEAARIAINKTIDTAINNNINSQTIGQPQVNITKLAPNNPLEYKIVLTMLPEIELGDYKNAKVKLEKKEVRDDEINKMIEYLRESQAKEVIADREVKIGDKIIADIEIFLDNVPIEGGQNKAVAIIIGKEYFIPGFDKKLIGAKKNDVRKFNLPYPKDHHQANLAGKLVDFKVTIKEIYNRQLPELNDNFTKSCGAKNLDELKINIKKNLEQEKSQKERQKTEIKMLDKILEKTKFGDIPEVLINHEAEAMIVELEQGIINQGGKFDDYLASLKKSRDQLILDLLPDALRRVKSAVMIREIAKEEKIKVEEKEIDEKINELLKQYKGQDKITARVKNSDYRIYLQNSLMNRKIIDKLREWNVE